MIPNAALKPAVFFPLLVCLFAQLALSSPPPTEAGGYGYALSRDSVCLVWWAEGVYKIMRQTPVPSASGSSVELFAARNEPESFLLVVRPTRRLNNFRVEASGFTGTPGRMIAGSAVSIKHVAYVKVTKPTGGIGIPLEWPDPLPPYEGPSTAYADENNPLWITVHVPENASPGVYRGQIRLSADAWNKDVPVTLTVWGFALPPRAHMRSSFGVDPGNIRLYHNLETDEEVRQVTDLYYRALKESRLCPTAPLQLYPMHVKVNGVDWEGGEFVTDTVHGGKTALKLSDNSVAGFSEGACKDTIAVEHDSAYELSLFAKTAAPGADYTVLVKCYNAEGEYLPFENIQRTLKGSPSWKEEKIEVGGFSPEVRSVTVHLFPTFRDGQGAGTGTAYFDDVAFRMKRGGGENLLPGGDFEADIDRMSVAVDFSEFDKGARRYLDEFGFNSFDLTLEGLPSGTFYSQSLGIFSGFRQRTPEYEKLMKQYLSQVQDHLEKNGWLGKEYLYWFDEPEKENYPFVREGMEIIHRAAPKLTRFITEMSPGPDIMDVSEISCTIWHHVDSAAVAKLSGGGREFWSYLCCQPRTPWLSLFIDNEAVNLRLWPWISYQYHLSGILVWSATYWNSPEASPKDYLQSPWKDPMSYVTSYGQAQGQINTWGNGDGRFLYPPNRDPNTDKHKYLTGPVNSLRLEILREGLQDYEYFLLLEKAVKNAGGARRKLAEEGRSLLHFPPDIFRSGQDYNKDPKVLLEHRMKIARVLDELSR